jgi:hypothetical protein
VDAHVQTLVSVDKMATMLEAYTTEEQRSVVRFFCWAEELSTKDINKEIFPVYGGKCLSRKAIHIWIEKFSQEQEVGTEVRKWLRQQSNDFYAAVFDALVKRWDNCINVGGGYIEK